LRFKNAEYRALEFRKKATTETKAQLWYKVRPNYGLEVIRKLGR
jgi:hypothetical protein